MGGVICTAYKRSPNPQSITEESTIPMFHLSRYADIFIALLIAAAVSMLPSLALSQGGIAEMLARPRLLQDNGSATLLPFHAEVSKLKGLRIGRDVHIEWLTQRETRNRGFEVQRASSESRGWRQVGFVQSGGDGAFDRKYDFRDGNVPPEDLRYMLRIVGDNGLVQYSQIISVPVSGTLRSFVVGAAQDFSPLPIARVELTRDETVSLQLADYRGNVIERVASNRLLASGSHEFPIDFSKLPSGEYEIILHTSEGRYKRLYEHRK